MTTASKLELEYIDGRHWLLTEDFSAHSDVLDRDLTVPAGFVTDFNSIPQALWSILPPTDYGEAAVLHDYLYRYADCTREEADKVHREFVQFRQAPGWKVWSMFRALRMFGGRAWGRYRAAENAVGAGGGTARPLPPDDHSFI